MTAMGHNSMAQSVFRAHEDRGYTKLRNEFLRDHRISDETRGLVARLLSHPVDWHFTIKEIISSGPSGRDKVYRMVKEAEEYGYIRQDSPRRENGTHQVYGYLVTDDPKVLIQRAAKEIFDLQNGSVDPLPEKPETDNNCGNPLPEKPVPANQEPVEPLPEKPFPAQPVPVNPHQTNKRDLQTNDRTKDPQPG
jgi:hypothetical protein